MVLTRCLARKHAGELAYEHSSRVEFSRPRLLVTGVTAYGFRTPLFSVPGQDPLGANRAGQSSGFSHYPSRRGTAQLGKPGKR